MADCIKVYIKHSFFGQQCNHHDERDVKTLARNYFVLFGQNWSVKTKTVFVLRPNFEKQKTLKHKE